MAARKMEGTVFGIPIAAPLLKRSDIGQSNI